LTSAASQAPVPDEGKITTGFLVLKIVLTPSSTRRASCANSGPRWSMIGMSIARRTRSGKGLGPGICRKCRPAVRARLVAMFLSPRNGAGASPVRPIRYKCAGIIRSRAAILVRTGPLKCRWRRETNCMPKLMPGLERRLRRQAAGDVLFDAFSRGRYATDASHYQMMPVGVVVPRTIEEAERAIAIADEEGATVLARGGGTSQCGQTVNESLVVDCSKHLTKILDLDVENRRCVVEPGIVLDELNRQLKPHGLW